MALTVPIVSLAAADSAAAMREACTAHGFMLLADHGVPPEVIARQVRVAGDCGGTDLAAGAAPALSPDLSALPPVSPAECSARLRASFLRCPWKRRPCCWRPRTPTTEVGPILGVLPSCGCLSLGGGASAVAGMTSRDRSPTAVATEPWGWPQCVFQLSSDLTPGFACPCRLHSQATAPPTSSAWTPPPSQTQRKASTGRSAVALLPATATVSTAAWALPLRHPTTTQLIRSAPLPRHSAGYYVGREEPGGPGALPLSGPNVWPPEEWCPGFSAAMMAYHRAMLDLSDRLLGVLEKALDLPAGWFAGKFDHGVATLRPLHYAPCEGDPGKGEFGAGE